MILSKICMIKWQFLTIESRLMLIIAQDIDENDSSELLTHSL
jgi:hypothetical protein